MRETIINILSYGAKGKVDKAIEEYEALINKMKSFRGREEKEKKLVKEKIDEVLEIKKKAFLQVRKVQDLIDIIKIQNRELVEFKFKDEKFLLTDIEESISIGEAALNLGKGSVVGAASGASIGAATWGLVGAFGTASTGTAIGSLSGVAATNATLAWFGGGSLATGGLGMAGGTAILGGIVAIPAFIATGIFQHWQANKKIEQIKKEGDTVLDVIDQTKANLLALQGISKRCDELIQGIPQAMEGFNFILQKAEKKLGFNSYIIHFYRKIRKLLGLNPYTKKDIEQIALLGGAAGNVLKLIDSKVI